MALRKETVHVIFLLLAVSVFSTRSYAIVFGSVATQNDRPNPPDLKYEISDSFVGSLKHTVHIANPTSHRVVNGELFIPIITNETGLRYVIVRNISSSIGQPAIVLDDSANVYAYWKDIRIDRDENLTVEIDYDVLSFSTRFLIDPNSIAEYDTNSSLYRKYTQPEELIQSDDSEIMWKAQSLTKDANNIHEKAYRVYDFVKRTIRYSLEDSERGALWALKNKTGDCSEYSYLFVALCRAAHIPARIQTGFAFNTVSESLKNGHMWSEYYLEEYGWMPVDATWKLFDFLDYKHFNSLQTKPGIPYSNFFFDFMYGPEEQYLEEEQTVLLNSSVRNAFSTSFVQNLTKCIKTIKEARVALSLGRLLGNQWLFRPATRGIEQKLEESRVQLQKAIENQQTNPEVAKSSVMCALENSKRALQDARTLINNTCVLFAAIFLVAIIAAVILLKRQRAQQRNPTD